VVFKAEIANEYFMYPTFHIIGMQERKHFLFETICPEELNYRKPLIKY